MEIFAQNSFINDSYIISLVLFNNVSNSSEIRNMAIKREINATLLKPQAIVDSFQVLLAANKALSNYLGKTMYTKSLHSEIIFSLSASRSITESFKNFGVENDANSILIVEISEKDKSSIDEICSRVRGDPVKVDSIGTFTNIPVIKQLYKIDESELAHSNLNDVVYSRMAAKEFVNY
ncbi:DgyrCDS7877 [Dimorphilus gyrociliatus]|uniref:DgyrCDS7877 n=1 Tax=Dimorphilus gyrociliatus TaxID=2664684 RepID=A0A7I8VU48_9ANNE|nr:DgyrCDS7877 [Dimorphilus gyrociliatus]